MKATLKLFKALPVRSIGCREPSHSLLKVTVPRGFIFCPRVIANYTDKELFEIAKDMGRTPEQWNSSFHKSWKKVRDADITQLVLEQIIHYFTTYGFESLGIYDKDSVYIPNEQLDVPGVIFETNKIDGINLVVIKGYTKEELKEKVLKMLSSGIALKEDTLNCVVEVCIFVGMSLEDLKTVKNKEVRIKLYEYLDILPEDPVEFLRYLLYRTINETLLIKSKEVIEKIAEVDKLPAMILFTKYKEQYGLVKLAEIFNRFKPLFLAFKSTQQGDLTFTVLNSYINRISRLSKIAHVPMKPDYLNGITSMIKRREAMSSGQLEYELNNVNTFRKIRLAYALHYRTKDVSSILYKIRNGKSWATEVSYDERVQIAAGSINEVVLKSIVDDINKRVGYKKIYLPKNVEYTLPATEKQFTGNLPSGSYVTVDQDMVFGIHWFNHKSKKGYEAVVDLDLSLMDTEGEKYGWDGAYRSASRRILFSGDVTDAPRPKGASELFYLEPGFLTAPAILMVNYYNYTPEEVPFEIVVAQHKPRNFVKNYTIDPNDIVCSVGSKIDSKQKILGIVEPVEGGSRFYFSETNIGKSITSSRAAGTMNARQYLVDFYTDTLSLSKILRLSDAKIVENEEDCDINLSLEKIEKDSILNLLS